MSYFPRPKISHKGPHVIMGLGTNWWLLGDQLKTAWWLLWDHLRLLGGHLGPLGTTRVLVCDNRWPFSGWLVIVWWQPGEYLAGSWRPLKDNCQSVSQPDGQYVAIFHAKRKFSQKLQIQGQRSRYFDLASQRSRVLWVTYISTLTTAGSQYCLQCYFIEWEVICRAFIGH